eukprot:12684460-Alexandrium_andersonii.AAC.1
MRSSWVRLLQLRCEADPLCSIRLQALDLFLRAGPVGPSPASGYTAAVRPRTASCGAATATSSTTSTSTSATCPLATRAELLPHETWDLVGQPRGCMPWVRHWIILLRLAGGPCSRPSTSPR